MTKSSNVVDALKRGVALHRAGQLEEAAAAYRSVLQRDKQNADALNLLGLVAQALGNTADGLALSERAIAAAPQMSSAHFNRANLLVALGRDSDAIACYRRAIELNPQYADALLNLGATMHRQGDMAGAIEVFREMTLHCDVDARGHFNLGRCLAEDGMHASALAALTRALELDPQYVDALITLAKVYADTDRLAEAIKTIKLAIARAPTSAIALTNLGTYLAYADDHHAALDAYDRALRMAPNYKSARVNRALTQLVRGVLAEGWDDYAGRAESDGSYKFRKLDLPWPKWQGESLVGKRIFIWGEQGLGDEVLFSGLIQEIAACGGQCTLGCAARLVDLFQRSFPPLTVQDLETVLSDQSVQRFDYHTSVNDLGRWCRRSFASFPNRSAYLVPEAGSVTLLNKQAHISHKSLLIGFSWRSFASHVGDKKTLPLDMWEPLFALQNAKIVNLQYGPPDALVGDLQHFQQKFPQNQIVSPDTDPGHDLNKLAARIQALDMVVTVSNTLAHLSGALGVPTLVAVPNQKARLWYWFKSGAFSPWYPSVRLWRWAETAPTGLGALLQGFNWQNSDLG